MGEPREEGAKRKDGRVEAHLLLGFLQPPTATFFSAPPHRVILILWISYLPTIITILHLTAYRNRVPWLPPVLGFYQWAAGESFARPSQLSLLFSLTHLLFCPLYFQPLCVSPFSPPSSSLASSYLLNADLSNEPTSKVSSSACSSDTSSPRPSSSFRLVYIVRNGRWDGSLFLCG